VEAAVSLVAYVALTVAIFAALGALLNFGLK
jgi:hypothetical protein